MTRHRGFWYALLGATVGLLLLLFVYQTAKTATLAGDIRRAQVANSTTLHNSAETLHAIKDCTEPEGICYQRGQKRTGDAVEAINRVVIIAAACSADLPQMSIAERRQRIEQCVIDQLAKDRGNQ